MPPVTRGFHGRARDAGGSGRLPPGQYLTPGFPVLTAGPTQHTPVEEWTFSIIGEVDRAAQWTWDELHGLQEQEVVKDIHCVTTWSKLATRWRGVSVQTLLDEVEPRGAHVMAFCDGGYTTNLPLADVSDHRAWIVHEYDGRPLEPAHGGPARLLVPHLYFWKSAKWIRGLRIMRDDAPGFWEARGYHDYGDPWREQRYQGD